MRITVVRMRFGSQLEKVCGHAELSTLGQMYKYALALSGSYGAVYSPVMLQSKLLGDSRQRVFLAMLAMRLL